MLHSVLRLLLRVLVQPLKWALQLKIRRLQAQHGAMPYASRVPGLRDEGSPPLRLSAEPSSPQILDFVTWRSPTYVGPMTDGVADNLAGVLSGRLAPRMMSVPELNHALLNTPSAYVAVRVAGRWVLDFRRIALYPHRKITLASYSFDALTGEPEITDTEGVVHRRGDPTFEAAFLHATMWWVAYVVAGLHNWVHFHLPDAMAEAQARLTRPHSVLARLLAPHVRFTTRINYAGFWLNQSSHDPDGWRRPLRPWACIPFVAEDFRAGIVENTAHHYADLQAHYAMPESLPANLPYMVALKEFFPPIERFVARVDPFIDDADWEELLTSLQVGLPGIRVIPRIRVLASFLWQVGVVHGTDHLSLSGLVEPFAFSRVPESLSTPFRLGDVSRLDRWKTLNTLQIFVQHNPNPHLRNFLLDVANYRFDGELAEAAQDFRRDLRQTAADLERRGALNVPLEDLPQSVCF